MYNSKSLHLLISFDLKFSIEKINLKLVFLVVWSDCVLIYLALLIKWSDSKGNVLYLFSLALKSPEQG